METRNNTINRKRTANRRTMTACSFARNYPEIRLRGKWLKDSGFESGQIITITCRDKELIVSTDGTRKYPPGTER